MREESQSLSAMYNRRKIDVVFTQTVIQPLQQQYGPGNLLQIILQRSRHMVNIGEIQIMFRPCIQYANNEGPFQTLAQKMMTCVTPICPEDFLAFSSATIEGNQIMSQPNISLTRPRNIVQNYINQLQSVKKKQMMSAEHYDSGLIESAGNGSTNTGFAEQSVTHPYSQAGNTAGFGMSRFEGDAYPRALIDRSIAYNADFCVQVSGGATLPGCEYFAPQVSVNADMVPNVAITGVFPLLPLSITPSIAIYKAQQTRFAHFRQRFITATVTPYYRPDLTQALFGQTYSINQAALSTLPLAQKVVYGQPINGAFGAASGSALVGQGTSRFTQQMWTTASANYFPQEQFTNCTVRVADTAVEFGPMGIGMICLDSSQVILQYLINNPYNCLSANLQGSYFATTTTGATPNFAPTVCAGALDVNYQTFLNCCALPQDTTFVLTDMVCRVVYNTYFDEIAYSTVRQLLYQPQAYYSLRMQTDVIQSQGTVFSRLSIGGSSLIAGVWVFITSATQAGTGAQNYASAKPSDTVVNLFGCNPPAISDLRGNQSWDSYALNLTDIYVQVNNKRYAVNAIPLSSNQYSTYLVTQSNLETAFGKHLNIPFSHYVANRFGVFIPMNCFGDRSEIITDNQLIISLSIDANPRINSSKAYGESSSNFNGQFALVTAAMTMQSLCDCSYVKIQ